MGVSSKFVSTLFFTSDLIFDTYQDIAKKKTDRVIFTLDIYKFSRFFGNFTTYIETLENLKEKKYFSNKKAFFSVRTAAKAHLLGRNWDKTLRGPRRFQK